MNEDRVIFDTVNSRGESIGRTAFDTAVFRGAIRSGNIRKLKEEELAKRLLEGVRFGL